MWNQKGGSTLGLFEFLMVLVSVVIGLGLTEILSGAANLLRARASVRFHWFHVLFQFGVFFALLQEFPRSQGLQPAGEDVADAVVRGVIKRYDLSTPSYRPGAPGESPEVLQRQVSIVVEVEVVNQVDDEILWQSPSVSVQGQYLEESETEDDGRALAIELLVQRIIDGAQSNW